MQKNVTESLLLIEHHVINFEKGKEMPLLTLSKAKYLSHKQTIKRQLTFYSTMVVNNL